MSNLKIALVDKIVENCLNLYYKLPKTGKPVEKEWTVLSCILKYDNITDNVEIVSLGSGSKCIGATKMSSGGDILNDSHAEVFARRGFLIYLYDNVERAIQNEPSIFNNDPEKGMKLKQNIEFIFYSSQLPCGDASIIPRTGEEEHFGDLLKNKRQAEQTICDVENKRAKFDADIHRTGAKCLPQSEQDLRLPGIDYQILGQVRTKPGRGDKTLSVSCSDKMARWLHLGIHGSLLDMLCEPIFIKHFIFGAGVPYSEESLTRALMNRNSECSVKLEFVPKFYQSSIPFPYIKTAKNARAAPGSIVWVKLQNPLLEVAVQGKKLGATKKKANYMNSALCISKYNLYKRFLNILCINEEIKQKILGTDDTDSIPYNKMKRKSARYSENWSIVKDKFFKSWTVKPDIWDFCVNSGIGKI